jgi:hypothetical protein
MLEYAKWKKAAFVTLTYNPENIPEDYSLRRIDLRNYIKRLRKAGYNIKYLACGEYGEKYGRPHYHLIIFGMSFSDEKILAEKWPFGNVYVGYSVNQKTCQYVCQYTFKKLKVAEYQQSKRTPPFICVSQGIGKQYAEVNKRVILEKGYIQYDGIKYGIPRYFFKLYQEDRALYYKEFIEIKTEQLVHEAVKSGVEVFKVITYDYGTDEYWLEWRSALAYGYVMRYRDEWFIVTKSFISYLEQKRENNHKAALRYVKERSLGQ